MTRAEAGQPSLFGQEELSGWLPDETLYSWCSRYHLVSCNVLPGGTTKALFGHRYLGSSHDFPCRIFEFVERTHGDLGPARSIISERTILPFFLPFQSRLAAQMALETVRGPSIGTLKFRLGLLTSHFRAHFPLKACAKCMAEDRNRYKIAYWHRSHQLPGAWVCTKHTGQMLIESRLKSSGSQRFGWILPEELHFRPVAQRPSESAILNLQCLADAANELARIEIGWHFDPAIFTDTILARLQQKGLASTSFRLKTNDIGSQFHEYISAFHGIEEFQAITGDEARTTAQATAYLRRIARITHPLRHLVMIAWLYPDWGTFFEDYKARTNQFLSKEFPSSDGETAIILKKPSIDFDLRDSCVRLSTTELLTATAIANRLDVTVTTVIAHLAAAGIRTPKRPKVLRGKKHSELLAALRDGISKQEAAEKIGASIGTVTRFLLSEVGLHQEWTQARDKLIREKMRLRWKALVSGNLTSTQKFLRAIEPGTYAWLYRNDREWLRTSSQGSNINPRPGGRSVDWAARDEQLSLLLGAAIRELVSNSRGRHIHLSELISHATQLKPYINKMDVLPRTHLLLKQFMKNSLVRTPDFFE